MKRVERLGIAIALAVVMVISASFVIGASAVASPSAPANATSGIGTASTGTAAAPSSASASSIAQGLAIDTSRAAVVHTADQRYLAAGGSSSTFFPPNLHEAPPLTKTSGHVVPLYSQAPAPMGVAYYGLNDTAGSVQASTLNTTALQATFSTSDPLGVQTEGFDFGTQTTYGAQLNAVLVNATVLGQTSFNQPINQGPGCGGPCPNEYWLQNVINYNTATHSLSFELNIWNFSNPSVYFPPNGVLGRGSVEGDEVYETGGPSITISYPFSLALYLNTTAGTCYVGVGGARSCTPSGSSSPITGPDNEVYFNYTVWNGLGQKVCPATEPTDAVCGEYDNVFFNSVNPSINPGGIPIHGPNGRWGSATIQANGTAYNPVGLTNDFEFDYGIGSSSGATTGVVYADATLGINYCPAANVITTGPGIGTCSAFASPPAAFDYGGETGETGQGAAGSWVANSGSGPDPSFLASPGQPVARYTTGPSLLQNLWNATGSAYPAGAGSHALSIAKIAPANAWVGVAAGAGVTNQSQFQVAPTFGWFSYWAGSGGSAALTTNGPNLYLEPGLYTVEVLLSGYAPVMQNVDLTSGGQTPSITLVRAASAGVYTPMWAFSNGDLSNLSSNSGGFGLGSVGNPYDLYTAAPTVGAPYGVSGSLSWLFSNLNDYLFTVWLGEYINSTTTYAQSNPAPSFTMDYPTWQFTALVDQFNVPTTDQFQFYLFHAQNFTIAGGSHIYAWGNSEATTIYSIVCNTCENDLIADNTFAVSDLGMEFINGGTALPAGTELQDTRNVVWGNVFAPDPQPTYTGLNSPSTGLALSEAFDRVYNNEFSTNGTVSSGSRGTNFENWWNVTCQGGYAPLTQATYPGSVVCQSASFVTSYHGLALTGSILGTSYQGGNFWFNYGNPANPYANIPYVARSTSPTGTAAIASTAAGARGDYAPLIAYPVYDPSFAETGLTSSSTASAFGVHVFGGPGQAWYNQTQTATPTATCSGDPCSVFYVPSGSYTYQAATSESGLATNPVTGSFSVSGAPVGLVTTFAFSTAYAVTFTETGLVSGTTWSISVPGQLTLSSHTTTIVYELPNGAYTYSIGSVAGYAVAVSGGSFSVTGAAVPIAVTFYAALTPASAPTVSATLLDQDQPLGVSANIPSTGVPTFSWSWLASVNGGGYGPTSVCSINGGSGASAGAPESCSIAGGTLVAGSSYAFELQVTDSASTPETQNSGASPTVAVASALTAPSTPTASATALDSDQALTVVGSLPTTGTAPYAWDWLVSVNGGTLSAATVCGQNSGTGGSAAATETCSVPSETLTAGNTYAFALSVIDGATTPETQTSGASATVSVASPLGPAETPTVSATSIDADQPLDVSSATPSTGTATYSWTWTESANGSAYVATTQCAQNAGTGAAANSPVDCSIAGGSLSGDTTYAFALAVSDSASTPESLASSPSATVAVGTALSAPGAPTVSATALDVDQLLTVSATIPTSGTATYSWSWMVSVDGGADVAASMCATASGSGAAGGSPVSCSVAGSTLTVGDSYAFALGVTDSAQTAEMQTSGASASVTVASSLTPPAAPSVNRPALDVNQVLTVSGTIPSSGSAPYSWVWLVSASGGAFVTATVCSASSGSGASAGATVTCVVPGGSLTVGAYYNFELQVTDGATIGEVQTSAQSPQTVTVASQLAVPHTPTLSASALDVDQPLTVSGALPAGGTTPLSWTWSVSVNGAAFVTATQCTSSSGTGGTNGQSVPCAISAGKLTPGDKYAFRLSVKDSATSLESEPSASSAKVSVSTALVASHAPTVSLTRMVPSQTLTVTGRLPKTGTPSYSWEWLVSVNGSAYVLATQCAVDSGSGGAASAVVTCAISAGVLSPHTTYSFELMVTDRATLAESQTSLASKTVTVV